MKIIREYKELEGVGDDTPEACREAEAAVDAKKARMLKLQNRSVLLINSIMMQLLKHVRNLYVPVMP